MPLYAYACDQCGDFRAWCTMSACDDPTPCPECGAMAGRAIAAPVIFAVDPGRRIAHARNEASAHEPKVVRGADWKGAGRHHGGAHGHKHDHHAHGHAHASRWPWMVGH